MSKIKPEVIHFQRKTRAHGNFSLEYIFHDVREKLKDEFSFKVKYVPEFSNGFYKRLKNILYVRKEQGALNHVTGDIHYVNLLLKRKTNILTVLDCGFMNEPNYLKRKILSYLWLKWPVRKAQYVTAISKATKDDIIKYTGCSPDKIYVIPVAVPGIFAPSAKTFNKTSPVLLQIGTAVNKNLERLIEAIQTLTCELVVIGKLTQHQTKLLEDCKIKYRNYFQIPEAEMYQQYVDCDIVAFVSTFEGFGMPIVEANIVERPVLAGDNTSMPEVGGNAACLVDAFSVECIRKGLDRIIQDDLYRNTLIENGKLNRERFSSEVIARLYGDLYQRMFKAGFRNNES